MFHGNYYVVTTLGPNLFSLSSAILDTSFSIALINLVPSPRLDGSHALQQYLRLLLPNSSTTATTQRAYHYLITSSTALLYTNILLAVISLLEPSSSA